MLRALAILAWLVAGTVLAAPAHGHASLVTSQPEAGAVLAVVPGAVTLTFSEPVAVTALKLIEPNGAATNLGGIEQQGAEVRASLPSLGSGTHLLSWRVVSDDGHPVGGAVAFSIGTASAVPDDPSTGGPWLRPLIWLARAVLYAGLFVAVGGASFAAFVAAPTPLPRSATGVMRGAAMAGLAAGMAALSLQGADLLGGRPVEALTIDALRVALTSTYARTLALAGFALVAALVALSDQLPWLQRLAAGLGLAALAAAFSVAGHASTAPPLLLSRTMIAVHMAGIAFWVGALVPLAALLRRDGRAERAALARFSRLVPHALVPLVIAGLVLAALQLERPHALWETDYGQILLAKLVLVALLLGLAALNRYRLTPRRAQAPAGRAPALRRSVRIEIAVVLAIFGVAALWRFTPPPRSLAVTTAPVASVAGTPAPPFFNHFHGERVAADMIISPGSVGPVTITVMPLTLEFAPQSALEVVVALSMPEAGIEATMRPATLQPDGTWLAAGFVAPIPGVWTVEAQILVSDFDLRFVGGPMVVVGN